MKPKKAIFVFILATLVFVAGFFAYRVFHPHPSDKKLIETFEKNVIAFEALATQDFSNLNQNNDAIFQPLGISSTYKTDIIRYFVASTRKGESIYRSDKGYAYVTEDPKLLAKNKSVQVFIVDDTGTGVRGNENNHRGQVIDSDVQIFLKPLTNNWYLFLRYEFY